MRESGDPILLPAGRIASRCSRRCRCRFRPLSIRTIYDSIYQYEVTFSSLGCESEYGLSANEICTGGRDPLCAGRLPDIRALMTASAPLRDGHRPGAAGRLAGKVAMVTGSTRGLGATIARQFASEGAGVAVTGRSAETGTQVVAAIQAEGGDAQWIPLDVTDEQSVADTAAAIDRHWGRLDIVVNNAAATDSIERGGDGRCEQLELASFDRIIRVGVHGAFLTTKHCVPLLRKSGGGSIINISSVAGVAGVPHMCAYSASKGALDAMTRQWAQDLGNDGVRANSIIVGFMASGPAQEAILDHPVLGPLFDAATLLRRRGGSADVADAAVFLASSDSGFMTGTSLVVDGGATARSGFPDPDAVFHAAAP